MTTAAAIDRLVHHSEILELNAESYRIQTAKTKQQKAVSKDPNDEEQQAKKEVEKSPKLEDKKVEETCKI